MSVDSFCEELGVNKSVVDNIKRGRSPQLETLMPLLRGLLEQKKTTPVEVLSILLGVEDEEIKNLDQFLEVDFSAIDISVKRDYFKEKIETLARELDSNSEKIETLCKSIPEIVSLAAENSFAKQKIQSIKESLENLWTQWEGKKVRLVDSPARYRSLDIAGGVYLVLEGRELDSQYEVKVKLFPHGDYLKEGLKLSVELGDERETLVAANKSLSLKELNLAMRKGDILDIVIECENRIYRNRFQY
ncbi:MAG: hypothetical protein AB4290_20580 [Spirulina sp.]